MAKSKAEEILGWRPPDAQPRPYARNKPISPMITIEFKHEDIYFTIDEYMLYEKFRDRVKEKLDTYIFEDDWPPSNLYTAEITIGRTNDAVWNYIQTMRDGILSIYNDIRKESA